MREKKKLALLLAVVMLVSALSGCGQKEEQGSGEKSYSATAKGYGGDVTVTLTIAGDQLIDVKVAGEKETANVGSIAVESLPQKMLDANSIEVEGVSGATVTSNAIRTAAADALAQSGATLTAKEGGEKEKDTYEDTAADVVVVGGGIAGMSAAMVLADSGKQVILLEKTNLLGGAATLSHSAVWAIGSPFTKDVSDFTADDIYEFFSKQAGPVHNKDVFYTLANESLASLNFLIDNGVVFDNIDQCNPQADPRFWLSTSEGFGAGMMDKLNTAFARRDIDTRTNTSAVELKCDAAGAVTGVVAEYNGEKFTITADQVILATGGHGKNEEMLAQYTEGYEYLIFNNTAAGATGDGHRMGVDVGGYIIGEGSIGVGGKARNMDASSFGNGLLVNIQGEKVGPVDEHYTKLYLDCVTQSDGKTYSIYPADIANYSEAGKQEIMEENYADDLLYRADTVEELAQQMGINVETLMETVRVHNDHCAKGEGDEFNSPAELMPPIVTGPFYGVVHEVGIIGTIAGLAVDPQMRVLREDGSTVGNLYAVGELTYGNWFNGSYPMSGTGLGGCVSSGRLAAADILAQD